MPNDLFRLNSRFSQRRAQECEQGLLVYSLHWLCCRNKKPCVSVSTHKALLLVLDTPQRRVRRRTLSAGYQDISDENRNIMLGISPPFFSDERASESCILRTFIWPFRHANARHFRRTWIHRSHHIIRDHRTERLDDRRSSLLDSNRSSYFIWVSMHQMWC